MKNKKPLNLESLMLKVGKGKKYNLAQFKAGMTVEKEHTDVTKGDPVKTAKIVIAHLKEVPNYYTKLAKVEGKPMKKTAVKKYDKHEKAESPAYEKLEERLVKKYKKEKEPTSPKGLRRPGKKSPKKHKE